MRRVAWPVSSGWSRRAERTHRSPVPATAPDVPAYPQANPAQFGSRAWAWKWSGMRRILPSMRKASSPKRAAATSDSRASMCSRSETGGSAPWRRHTTMGVRQIRHSATQQVSSAWNQVVSGRAAHSSQPGTAPRAPPAAAPASGASGPARSANQLGHVGLLKQGSAYYAPSSAAAAMVAAVLGDTGEVMPVCAWVTGQYGIDGVYLGVPARLGRGGVAEVVELPLTEAELDDLREAAEAVRSKQADVAKLVG